MKIDINAGTGTSDDFYAFARTHVAFATFHPHHRFEDCRLELYMHGPGRAGCSLSTTSPELGTIEVNAVADDAYDVVARAAELLQSEVDRRIERHERARARSERASSPVAQMPLHATAPAPQPTSTSWAEIG